MSKKVVIPVVLAVLAAVVIGLFAVDAAFAKEGGFLDRFKRANGVLGKVSEIKTNEFSITKRDGGEVTFHVSEDTRFIDRDRNTKTFVDVIEGGWVLVAAPVKAGEKPAARLVVILPEDFDPENMALYRGVIAGVNISENEVTLKTRDDQEIIFAVNEDTHFTGEATDLATLEEGLKAGITAEELSDGSLLAWNVRSTYPLVRKAGQVIAVDVAAGTFTLKGRDGIEVTFTVNEETRFRRKNGKLDSLADLKQGMISAVVAVDDPAYSTPLAKLVIAVDRQVLAKTDARFAGKVTAVDDRTFSINTLDGKTITFQVTGNTRFRSRDGSVKSMADLKEGMILVVGAKELGKGKYQAQVVLIGRQ